MTDAVVAAVEFPVVVVGEALLTSVRVERLTALDRQERFALGHQRDEVLDMLIDARSGEPDSRRLDGVLVRFLRRDFSGQSFGVALALADKRARYPGGFDKQRLIATGQIVCGSRGAIGAIEGFEAKARAVLASLDGAAEPAIFVFPTANWRAGSEAMRTALETAQAQGRILLRPADRLEELVDLWGGAGTVAPEAGSGARPRRAGLLAAAAAGVAVVGTAAAFGFPYLQGAPVRGCESALGAIESEEARAGREGVAAAVQACAEAARKRPASGRAQFLAGQAHALNGSERLAASYWRRAAEAGDKDGLAAWGRMVWLADPDDLQSTQRALEALNKAAELDSAAALEDMAEIYREGRAVPPDLARAEALLERARRIRGGGK